MKRNTCSQLLCTFILVLVGFPPLVHACVEENQWGSISVLSTLLSGNPALTITFESSELKFRNGRINLSAEANIASSVSGNATITGDGVLKARGRYTLITRGQKRFIKINSVRADLFTTRLFVEGELASEDQFSGLVFSADREIQYRCVRGNLKLIQEVDETRRVLGFQPRPE